MALHGDLRANGQGIGIWWAAQRMTPDINGGGECEYQCEVRPDPLNVLPIRFTIRHRYDDGALVLAAKVLARAIELRAGGEAS